MALLRGVRHRGPGGVAGLLPGGRAAVVWAVLTLSACGPVPENPPDQLLRDSLGLDGTDVVHRVIVAVRDDEERADPAELEVVRGTVVEFFAADRRLHTIRFELDSLSAEGVDFLRETTQDRSPPLLDRGTRFVMTFSDAPPGRYPYRVEGTGRSGRGAIVVMP